jgi:phospholipid/cholesterol/gamma-HCH transport system ATP-binding protein
LTAATPLPEDPIREPAHASLRDVWKKFGERPVLEGVSLDLRPGEVTVVIGGSGCGKSTLLRILLGLETYDRGSVRLFGREMKALSRPEQADLMGQVGMLFQFGALFDSMTVGENVGFALRYVQRRSDAEIAERVRDNLALVGLPDVEQLYPAQLSGGMRKRVALARAIAHKPSLLCVDEPTTGLDPVMSETINELILSMRDKLGVTVLCISHDLAAAFRMADRIAMIDKGRIAAFGTPDEVRACDDPAVQAFVAASTHGAPRRGRDSAARAGPSR